MSWSVTRTDEGAAKLENQSIKSQASHVKNVKCQARQYQQRPTLNSTTDPGNVVLLLVPVPKFQMEVLPGSAARRPFHLNVIALLRLHRLPSHSHKHTTYQNHEITSCPNHISNEKKSLCGNLSHRLTIICSILVTSIFPPVFHAFFS